MNKMICMEGSSGSGKTTIAKSLDGKGLLRIGEYFHYLLDGESFPNLQPSSPDGLKKVKDQLVDLCLRREIDIKKLIPYYPLLTERGLISLLYVELARSQRGYLANVKELGLVFHKLFSMGQLIEPYKYIFLEASNEELIRRVNIRSGRKTNSFFTEPETIDITRRFLNFYKKEYLSQGDFIDIKNEGHSIEDTIKEISEKINFLLEGPNKSGKAMEKLCLDITNGLDIAKII